MSPVLHVKSHKFLGAGDLYKFFFFSTTQLFDFCVIHNFYTLTCSSGTAFRWNELHKFICHGGVKF